MQVLAAQVMNLDQRWSQALSFAEKQPSIQLHSVARSLSTEQRRSTQWVPVAHRSSSGQPQASLRKQLSHTNVLAAARLSQSGAKRAHTAGSINGAAPDAPPDVTGAPAAPAALEIAPPAPTGA